MAMKAMNIFRRLVVFLATGCYFGYSKYIPGTIGTLSGLPLAIIVAKTNPHFQLAALIGFIVVAIIICMLATHRFKRHDAKQVVIDEWAGIMATFLWLPITVEIVVAGFILFRFFDIFKFGLVAYMDRKIKTSVGVVGDDVIAGLQACLLLHLWLQLTKNI